MLFQQVSAPIISVSTTAEVAQRRSGAAFVEIGWQSDASGLEDDADLAGDGGAGDVALAVLLDGRHCRRSRSRSKSPHSMTRSWRWHRSTNSFCFIRAINKQNTCPGWQRAESLKGAATDACFIQAAVSISGPNGSSVIQATGGGAVIRLAAILVALTLALTGVAFGLMPSAQASSTNEARFTALHTYYMSPTGGDNNSGTSSSSPWATPNHNIDCGDVIIAAPGVYNSSGIHITTTPSNCPSTSGGIDGTGGIYFAIVLCNGNVGACYVNFSGGFGDAISIAASNWAIEGWEVSSNSIGSSGGRGFEAYACATGTTTIHHISFINDIVTHAQDGYDTNDCGMNHSVPGNGVDYFAVVGSIAHNANNDPICLAAFDDVGPANSDTVAGVHVFFGGDFAINNQNPACPTSDGEGMMFDTWDAHGYVGTGVIEQSIVYSSSWAGLQVFQQKYNSSNPQIQIFNNTFFDNNVCTRFTTGVTGDINFQLNGGYPWTLNVYNNIAKTAVTVTGCHGAGPVYAELSGGANGVGSITMNLGGNGIQNIFKGLQTSCQGTVCDPGHNIVAFNGFGIGTNTYLDPRFQNTADLLANQLGAPNCSSYTNVTACMGWNYSNHTATNPSVIYDLTAEASGAIGKGYFPPGACAADPYYPAWLKGVVYLQWNGTNFYEVNGLVNKPCGL
jgi:hypothetical protein